MARFSPARIGKVKFGRDGLVPAIVQGGIRGRVLMLAYMNRRALRLTVKTGMSHFYSRSRRRIWKKGEESGHVQKVRQIRLDCDRDVILLIVSQRGAGACHTGHASCFFRRLGSGGWKTVEGRRFNPARAYGKR